MPCEHKVTCTDCAPPVKKCLQCRKEVKEKIWTILVNINSEGSGPEIGGRRTDNLGDDIDVEGLPNHQDSQPQDRDTIDHMIEREWRDRIHEEAQGELHYCEDDRHVSNEQPEFIKSRCPQLSPDQIISDFEKGLINSAEAVFGITVQGTIHK